MTSSPRRLLLAVGVALGATLLPAQDPTETDLRGRAFAAVRAGDHATAGARFRELFLEQPDNADWALRAADFLGRAGSFNDALEVLDQAQERFPRLPDLLVMRARTLHLKAEQMRGEGVTDEHLLTYYREAEKVAREVLGIDERHLEALLTLAQAQYELGRVDQALGTAIRAAEEWPDAPGGHSLVGKIRFYLFTESARSLRDPPEDAVARAELAEAMGSHREAAVQAFEAAHRADPGRAYPLASLGDLATWQRDLERALDFYARALSIDPRTGVQHAWIRENTSAEQRVQLYRRARDAYRERPGAEPKRVAVGNWYLGVALMESGDNEAARTLLESTLEPLPELADTGYYLMLSAYRAGDEASAAEHAGRFAAKAPARFADMLRQDADGLQLLTYLAAKDYQGNRFDRCRDLNQVLAYAAPSVDAWNNYAFMCRTTGQFEQGYFGYQQALRLAPNDPQILNDCAVILHRDMPDEANLEKARALYLQAIEEGERRLTGDRLSDVERQRIEQAIENARNNLTDLDG